MYSVLRIGFSVLLSLILRAFSGRRDKIFLTYLLLASDEVLFSSSEGDAEALRNSHISLYPGCPDLGMPFSSDLHFLPFGITSPPYSLCWQEYKQQKVISAVIRNLRSL